MADWNETDYERERKIRKLMNDPKELERRLMVGDGFDDEAEEASDRLFWKNRIIGS